MSKRFLFVALALLAAGCSGAGEDVDQAGESEDLGEQSQAYTPTCSYTPTGIPRRNLYLYTTVDPYGGRTITVKNNETCRTPATEIRGVAFCRTFTGGVYTFKDMDPIQVPALDQNQSLSWPAVPSFLCPAYFWTVDEDNTIAETNENDNSISY